MSGNLNIEKLRRDTPGCAERIHLNNAGAALMPRPVLDSIKAQLDLEAQIGGYEAADAKREAINRFYDATADLTKSQPRNIAFTANATDSFARAVSSIPFQSGDIILTTNNDYISNQIAFLSLAKRFAIQVIRAPDSPEGGVDLVAMQEMIDRYRPKLVSVTHIPTNSGLIQPVVEIGKLCSHREIIYLVDACQSAGQLPLDVNEIGCDFLTATARKFLRGPRGAGFLYVADRILKLGYEPLFIDMRGALWRKADAYQQASDAKRFEDWEFSYALLLGTASAITYATDLGLDTLSKHTLGLSSYAREKLTTLTDIKVLDKGSHLGAIISLKIPGCDAGEFKAELDSKCINTSISYRDYAVIDFDQKGVDWALRVSPHYYNTEDEIDRLVEALELIHSERTN
ncbi:aminotransferase class V-fold PLP-dependent enzyme [bacterium]|nr:aminotransferase class V-fold PLP-dependent enzyme [bacterium]